MKRTQLYLTQEQLDWLKKTAKQQGTTMAEINRKAIEAFRQSADVTSLAQHKTENVFLKMAQIAKERKTKGPKDLASNLDKYLYQ